MTTVNLLLETIAAHIQELASGNYGLLAGKYRELIIDYLTKKLEDADVDPDTIDAILQDLPEFNLDELDLPNIDGFHVFSEKEIGDLQIASAAPSRPAARAPAPSRGKAPPSKAAKRDSIDSEENPDADPSQGPEEGMCPCWAKTKNGPAGWCNQEATVVNPFLTALAGDDVMTCGTHKARKTDGVPGVKKGSSKRSAAPKRATRSAAPKRDTSSTTRQVASRMARKPPPPDTDEDEEEETRPARTVGPTKGLSKRVAARAGEEEEKPARTRGAAKISVSKLATNEPVKKFSIRKPGADPSAVEEPVKRFSIRKPGTSAAVEAPARTRRAPPPAPEPEEDVAEAEEDEAEMPDTNILTGPKKPIRAVEAPPRTRKAPPPAPEPEKSKKPPFKFTKKVKAVEPEPSVEPTEPTVEPEPSVEPTEPTVEPEAEGEGETTD